MAEEKKNPKVADAKGRLSLRGFSGGLVAKLAYEDMALNQVREAFNVDMLRRPGVVQTRRGRSKYFSTLFETDCDIHYQNMFTNVGVIIRSGTDLYDETIKVDFDLTNAVCEIIEHANHIILANGTDTKKYAQTMELTWHGCYTFEWEKDEIPAESISYATVLPMYICADGVTCTYGWERDDYDGHTGFVNALVPDSVDNIMFYQERYYYNSPSTVYRLWTHVVTNDRGGIGRAVGGSGSGAYREKEHMLLVVPISGIPQGSTIQEAKLSLNPNSNQSNTLDFPVEIQVLNSISAEMITNDGSTTYSGAAELAEYTALDWLDEIVEWTPGEWAQDSRAYSPDIKDVIQQVVDFDDWTSGSHTIMLRFSAGDYNLIANPGESARFFDTNIRIDLQISWGDSKAGRTSIYTTSVDVGLEYADNSAVAQSDFATPVDLGVPAPSTGPTIAQGAATGLTGTYSYKVGYGNGNSFIGNLSPASNDITVSDKKVNIVIPLSSDPQVTERRIYRTENGGTDYKYLATVSDNITTTYTDEEDDDSVLGVAEETDHDMPVDFARIHSHLSLIYGNDSDNTHIVYNSKAYDNWEAFPTTNYEPFGSASDTIAALRTLGEFFVVINNHAVINLNTKETPEEKADSFADRGAQGPKAVYHCGDAIAIGDPGGIFLYDTVRDLIISTIIDPIFDEESDHADRVNADYGNIMALVALDDRIYLSYVSVREDTTANNSTLIYDRKLKSFDGIIRTGYNDFTVDEITKKVYGAGVDGYIYQIDTGTDDDGTAIDWSFRTKDIANEYLDALAKKKGDKAKIDCNPNGGTITVDVYLDDVLRQTITITGSSRTVKRWRLPVDYNFYRLSFDISGTGAQTIYGLSMTAEVVGF